MPPAACSVPPRPGWHAPRSWSGATRATGAVLGPTAAWMARAAIVVGGRRATGAVLGPTAAWMAVAVLLERPFQPLLNRPTSKALMSIGGASPKQSAVITSAVIGESRIPFR